MEIRRQSFFKAPPFWLVDWEGVNGFIDGLAQGQVWTVGHSAGGLPIRAVAYGQREELSRRTTLSGAVAAGHPEDFYHPKRRQKPVLLIICTIHGAEIEGTAAAINLLSLLERGQDLRARAWDPLVQLAEDYRIVVLPLAQPDGRRRSGVLNLLGGSEDDLYYYGQGQYKNGEILRWPECKRLQPIPLEEMEFLGGYYNDAGINIQHDDFFSAQMAPETRALIDLVQAETPDAVLTLHSCGSGPFIIAPENYIAAAAQFHQVQIGALVAERHRRDGLRPGGGSRIQARGGFYLHTAFYHACACLPLLFEFPHGLASKPFSFDEIVDVGLGLFEEVLRYGAKNRFWPR